MNIKENVFNIITTYVEESKQQSRDFLQNTLDLWSQNLESMRRCFNFINVSGQQPTTLVNNELFLSYFSDILLKFAEHLFLEHLYVAPEFYNERRLQQNMIMNHEMKRFQDARTKLVLIKANVKQSSGS